MKAAFWITFGATAAVTLLILALSHRDGFSPTARHRGHPEAVHIEAPPPRESRIRLAANPASLARVTERATSRKSPTAPAPAPLEPAAQQLPASALTTANNLGYAESAQRLLPDRPIPTQTGRAKKLVMSKAHLAETLANAHHSEANSIFSTLNDYARAWNAKNEADIHALRPGLGRHTVKEELAGARSIAMRIEPLSAPEIEGNRATVDCLHHVDQVFQDGTEKNSPDVHMTYILVKRGSGWLIADSR